MGDSKNKSIVSELRSDAYSHIAPSRLDTTTTPNKKERKHLTIFVTILILLILLFLFF